MIQKEMGALRRKLVGLERSLNERSPISEEAYRITQTHAVLNRLLYIAIENIPLEDMLQRFLYEITSLSWLALQSKGAIFLVDATPLVLEMKAHRAMNPAMVEMCRRVPFGECLCGRAASAGKFQFADCIDERHERNYAGIAPHGHYCIPIISREGGVIGVISLYLNEGHQRVPHEEAFLTSVANTLACLVEIKKAHRKLEHKALEIENRRRDLDEINTALRVLLDKRSEDRLELEETFLINVRELIQPWLEKLKRTGISPLQRSCIDAVESKLKSIMTPLVRKMSASNLNFTTAEIQISDLITDGKRTKEIAALLNVSEKTVAVHRRNIRRKLGLQNKKASLRAHLLSLTK